MSKRFFEVKIVISNDSPTLVEGLKEAKQIIESYGLKSADIKPVQSRRTLAQNNALWKFYELLAEELNEKGLDLRTTIRDEIDIPWTKNSVHDYLWLPIQKSMFGTKSTTKLDKTEQINAIWDTLNRALTERFNGEVVCPNWPSINIDEDPPYNL